MSRGDDDGPASVGRWPTLLLVAALIIPFLVKTTLGHEPYPAAILPEGGSQLTTSNGTVRYEVTALFANDEHGDLVEVDAERFLDPIPLHYLLYVGRSEFGLADLADHMIRLRGTDVAFDLPRHHPTAEQREEIAAWLRERLREQGFDESSLVIRRIEHRTDIDSGVVMSTRTTSEASVDL